MDKTGATLKIEKTTLIPPPVLSVDAVPGLNEKKDMLKYLQGFAHQHICDFVPDGFI